jgi:voltage-gated potassium channel Kch
VPYVIVDINAENVRRAIHQDEPAYFGDVTSSEVLEAMGAEHARELVIVINDVGATERAVRAARTFASTLPILVRAQYAADVERLIRAGATDVITAELEASAEITQRVLHRCGVSSSAVAPQIDRIRSHLEDE